MPLRRLARGLATSGLALACVAAGGVGAQAFGVRAVELGSTLNAFIPADALLPLTTTSVLIRTLGPVEHFPQSCADGAVQLVERLDGVPKITSIPTPVGEWCGADDIALTEYALRLSATRVLMVQFGPDLAACTDDDGVFLLDDLGGANRVVPIPLGNMCDPAMVRLDDDTAAVRAGGGTALLSGLGTTNAIAWLPSAWPKVLASDRLLLPSESLVLVGLSGGTIEQTPLAAPPNVNEIVALDPTRLLVRSRGADDLFNSADDVTFILRDVGPSLETVELPTPYSHYFSQTLRLSPTRVLVSTNGPDGEVTTADDEILLLDHLDATPTVTPLAVPMFMRSTLVALGPDLAVAAARGPGAPHHDELVVLRDLGASNYVYGVHVGVLGTEQWLEGGRGAPVRIGPRTAAIATLGPDGAWPSADDQVATLTVTGQGAELRTLGVPYLSWRALLPLPPTGALVSSIGPGDDLDNARDDAAFAIGGLPSAPTLRRRRAPSFGGYPIFTGQPTFLGNGRAVYQDWVAEDGSNDRPHHLQVIRGLEGGLRLRARRISIRFGPAEDARLAASADLFLPEPERFASSDLAVRVGNASQTIPRGSFEPTATGFRYLDPGGGNGFLRRVEYDAAASRLEIDGQGTGTGAETTKASNLVLSLESLDLYVAESLDGEKRRGGIFYRRP